MSLKDFFSRTTSFVNRYRKHPIFVFMYALNYHNPSFVAGAKFFSPDDFVKEIQKGRSFLRFGDGEVHIMNGGPLPAQKFELGLYKIIRTMTKEYRNDSPYILGFSRFINKTNTELREEKMFFIWLPAKIMYKLLFPKHVMYGDAHFFYYDGFFQKYLEPYLLDKHLIVVTNEKNIESMKSNKNMPFKRMSFVATPSKDAYSEFTSICNTISEDIKNLPKGEVPVIVLAAGPTSKHIVYDFSKKGIQSLDIGTGFEVLYKNETLEKDYVLP